MSTFLTWLPLLPVVVMALISLGLFIGSCRDAADRW